MDKKAGKKVKQTSEVQRKTGIDIIGDAPWGTHFCQFYKTQKDLTDILVPYFKAGLENNEFCMWVTSEPLKVEDAGRSLRKAVKNLDEYIEKGQMEILDYSQWYTKTGKFDADTVLQGWVAKEQEAFKRGFDGLRLTGNTFWLGKEDWRDFFDYEARVDGIIGRHRMMALCTYSLDKCGINEVLDVTANHEFALIKQEGKWGMIQGFKTIQFKKELKDSVLKWKSTFDAIKDAVSLIDVEGKIVRSNRAMSDFLGKPFQEIIGRKCWELLHGTSEPIPKCPIVRMKKTLQRETLTLSIGDRWFEVTADPILDESGGLNGAIHTISDITVRKKTENELKKVQADVFRRQDAILNLSEDLMTEIEERKEAQKKIAQYHARLRNLASQMALVEENERRRIANVLHDSVGQNLALSKILLDELQEANSSGPLSLSLGELINIIDEAINSTRNLTFEISSPVLYELGVEAAIEWLGEKLFRWRKILFEFRNDRHPKPLTKEAQVLLFQAVREFYVNIIKHSKAHHVRVILQKLGGNFHISIEDDGMGLDPNALHSQVSESLAYGLFSIRERISLIGGSFGIESTPGQGTRVTLIAPLAS